MFYLAQRNTFINVGPCVHHCIAKLCTILPIKKLSTYFPLKIDFRKEAYTYLWNLSERKRNVEQQFMRNSYVLVVQCPQKKLNLNSQLLKDITCLSTHFKSCDWTVELIGWLASRFPHLLSEHGVSIVKDQWRIISTRMAWWELVKRGLKNIKTLITVGQRFLRFAVQVERKNTLI